MCKNMKFKVSQIWSVGLQKTVLFYYIFVILLIVKKVFKSADHIRPVWLSWFERQNQIEIWYDKNSNFKWLFVTKLFILKTL